MHHAAIKGHEAVVRVLIKHGAQLNVKSKVVCDTVVLKDTDFAFRTPSHLFQIDRRTPLHYASMNGFSGTVEAMLEFGVDVLAQDSVRVFLCKKCRVTL